jgi:hypothetical protein
VFGDGWDEIVWNDFFGRYANGIGCAGTPVLWHPCNSGSVLACRLISLAHEFQSATGISAAIYGGRDPRTPGGTILYPNGSGAIYSTALLLQVFAGFEGSIEIFARHIRPWDMEIGLRFARAFGSEMVSHVGILTRSYSTFGDCILNYDERKKLLLSGKVSVIHQAKDDWVP